MTHPCRCWCPSEALRALGGVGGQRSRTQLAQGSRVGKRTLELGGCALPLLTRASPCHSAIISPAPLSQCMDASSLLSPSPTAPALRRLFPATTRGRPGTAVIPGRWGTWGPWVGQARGGRPSSFWLYQPALSLGLGLAYCCLSRSPDLCKALLC